MDGNVDPQGFRKHGAVEGQLMGVPVATRVGFEPRQVVARFEVNDPLDRFEPIDSDLAGESAVLGSHDTLGDSVLQQIDSRLVHRDRFVHPLDRFELRIREDRFTNRRCPVTPGFCRSSEWLPGAGIDRTADTEVFAESFEAFEDQHVGGSTDQVCRRFFLGAWLGLLAVVELGALAKVGQLVAGKVVLRFGVIFFG